MVGESCSFFARDVLWVLAGAGGCGFIEHSPFPTWASDKNPGLICARVGHPPSSQPGGRYCGSQKHGAGSAGRGGGEVPPQVAQS